MNTEARRVQSENEYDATRRKPRTLDLVSFAVSLLLTVAICIIILSISRMPASCDVYCASWPLVEGPALVLIPILGITLLVLSVVNLALHGVRRRPLPWILLLLPLVVAVLMTLLVV